MKLIELNEDESLSPGDWIISQFEAGDVSYEDALTKLRKNDLEEWVQELHMANELKKGFH